MECQYCNKTFSSKYYLQVHKKYCLKIEGKSRKGDFECTCGKTFIEKHNQKIKQKVFLLRQQIVSLQEDKLYLQERYNKLVDTLTISASSTNSTNSTNSTVHSDLNLGVFDKTQEDISRLVNENYNKYYLLEGQKGVARFTNLYVIKSSDATKPPIYVIIDKMRGNGKYKVSDTEVVIDIGMLGLIKKVLPSIKKKALNIAAVENGYGNEKLFDGYQEVFNMEEDNGVFREELIRILERYP